MSAIVASTEAGARIVITPPTATDFVVPEVVANVGVVLVTEMVPICVAPFLTRKTGVPVAAVPIDACEVGVAKLAGKMNASAAMYFSMSCAVVGTAA